MRRQLRVQAALARWSGTGNTTCLSTKVEVRLLWSYSKGKPPVIKYLSVLNVDIQRMLMSTWARAFFSGTPCFAREWEGAVDRPVSGEPCRGDL